MFLQLSNIEINNTSEEEEEKKRSE